MTTWRKVGGGHLKMGSRRERRRRRATGGSAFGCWLPSYDCGICQTVMSYMPRSRRTERSEGLHALLADVAGRGRPLVEISDRTSPLPPSLRPTPGCTA